MICTYKNNRHIFEPASNFLRNDGADVFNNITGAIGGRESSPGREQLLLNQSFSEHSETSQNGNVATVSCDSFCFSLWRIDEESHDAIKLQGATRADVIMQGICTI